MADAIDDGLVHSSHNIDHLLDELQTRFSHTTTVEHPHQDAIRHINEVGRYIIPSDHIWAAHRRLVLNPDAMIGFSPNRYPLFDYVIANFVALRALVEPESQHFHHFYTVRENIAIVRNVLMLELFAKPNATISLDQQIIHLRQICMLIVEGLNNDRLFSNPLKPRIRISIANVPGAGARHIYEQIIKRQDSTHWLSSIINMLYGTRPWGLPAVEQSPFSIENLRKPAPADEHSVNQEDLANVCDMMNRNSITPVEMANSYVEGVSHIADDLVQSGGVHNSIDSLREPTRRESVEIAKEILRKLKVKLGSALIVNGLTSVTSSNFAILDALKGVVGVYEFHLHQLLKFDPKALLNPTIALANDAIGKLGYVAKTEALRVAKKTGNHKQVKAITEQIKKMPPHWQQPKEQTFGQLFEQMENGLGAVMTRLSQLSDPKAAVNNFVGRQNFRAVGAVDSELQKTNKPQQAMANNDYYQDVNAQRQQQQQAQQQARQAQAGQAKQQSKTLDRDVVNKSATNAPKKPKIDRLVNPNDIASMRNQMKTDKNAAPVLVGNQARQAQLNQEKARLEQVARQQRMKVIQNANQAKQNEEEVQHRQQHKNDKHHNDASKYQEAAHKQTSATKLAGDKMKPVIKETATVKDTLPKQKDTPPAEKPKESAKLKEQQNLATPVEAKMIEAPLQAAKKKDPSLLR